MNEEWVEKQRKILEVFERQREQQVAATGNEDVVMGEQDGRAGEVNREGEQLGAGLGTRSAREGGVERERIEAGTVGTGHAGVSEPGPSTVPAVGRDPGLSPVPAVVTVPASTTGPAVLMSPAPNQPPKLRVMVAQGPSGSRGPPLPGAGKTKVGPPKRRPRPPQTRESQRFRQLAASFRTRQSAGVNERQPGPSGSRLRPPTIQMRNLRVGSPPGRSPTPSLPAIHVGRPDPRKRKRSEKEDEEEEEGVARKRYVCASANNHTPAGQRIPPVPTGVFNEVPCMRCWKRNFECERQGWGRSCVACGVGKAKCYWHERDAPPPKNRARQLAARKAARKITPESEDEEEPAEAARRRSATKGKAKGKLQLQLSEIY